MRGVAFLFAYILSQQYHAGCSISGHLHSLSAIPLTFPGHMKYPYVVHNKFKICSGALPRASGQVVNPFGWVDSVGFDSGILV